MRLPGILRPKRALEHADEMLARRQRNAISTLEHLAKLMAEPGVTDHDKVVAAKEMVKLYREASGYGA